MKIINSIKDLYGVLNPYIDKPLSDDDIDDAIGETLFERNFKCCPSYENMNWQNFKNIQWQSEIDDNGKVIIKRVNNDTKL